MLLRPAQVVVLARIRRSARHCRRAQAPLEIAASAIAARPNSGLFPEGGHFFAV
jgi:hypothetical protein